MATASPAFAALNPGYGCVIMNAPELAGGP
jgi:hypothetical protein